MKLPADSEDVFSTVKKPARLPADRFASWLMVKKGEYAALSLAFVYFFLLLGGYSILKPVRDAMGLAGGAGHLPWLFTATFVVMLAMVPAYGWLCSRFSRPVFLPCIYGFFALNLAIFFIWFRVDPDNVWGARTFFIWLSVFNLFVVSVFWSLMADVFNKDQSHRLFGLIAAGGSAGAIAGPLFTALFVEDIGVESMLIISALLLLGSIGCILALIRWRQAIRMHDESQSDATGNALSTPDMHHSIGGGALAGMSLILHSRYLLSISLFIVLASVISTFLYLQQAAFVSEFFPGRVTQTRVFAAIDLAVNILSLLIQLFVANRLIRWWGVAWTLAAVPILMTAFLIGLALFPGLPMLVVAMIVRRAGQYAIIRPAREILFTTVNLESKYKAKNFIDTVLFRGGDAFSSWLFAPVALLGVMGIGLIGAGLSVGWAWLGHYLGRQHDGVEIEITPRNA
ncbi:MAG TPA: MFS transporter [Nitrosomonas halophila]|nr:MFS transporter [Nitrosomonas halophila]